MSLRDRRVAEDRADRRGHVFVVHGMLENLDHDAVVVPTDLTFTVGAHWAPVLGTDADGAGAGARHLQPPLWTERRSGRALDPVGRDTGSARWFIDAAFYFGEESTTAVQELASRLRQVLREIDAAEVAAHHGRARPLVALPTLGTGDGGFGDVRGLVIDELLRVCLEAVASSNIDVVIVASSATNYAAFQARRRALLTGSPAPRHLSVAQGLAVRARAGDLAVFIGAGVSVSAGLPSWSALLAELTAQADFSRAELDELEKLSDLDKAEVLSQELGPRFREVVKAAVSGKERYGLSHALLAALGCREVVTTNYDALYELAANDILGDRTIARLPRDRARPGVPWILKMHGDVERADGIVLTRSDFVSYDAKSRPLGSIVQALMATKHLLVVGASMKDDNFLRLAHEVFAFQEKKERWTALEHSEEKSAAGSSRPIGTVVALRDEQIKRKLWSGRFDVLPISDEAVLADQSRDLSIFLDLVAMHAADAAHLLDERYENLLSDGLEREAAEKARALEALIATMPMPLPDGWAAIATELRGRGAGGSSNRA